MPLPEKAGNENSVIKAGNERTDSVIKAVMFDIDDTLYDMIGPFGRAYEDLFPNDREMDVQKLMAAYRCCADAIFMKAETGEMTMEEMYILRARTAFQELGSDLSDEEALAFQDAYGRYQKELALSECMKEILAFCAERVKVGIISNGPAGHQWKKVHTLGLLKWIPKEHIIISGDYGIPKPERRIFEIAAAGIKEEPPEICYAGDSFVNDVIGASNAGFRTIWLNRRKKVCPDPSVPDDIAGSEEELRGLLKRQIVK